MNGLMEYKGYYGSASFSEEDMVFHGKLEFIRDLVLYESDIAKGIVKEFHDAVDDYLDFCKEQGKEPDKPFKGVFNVRVRPELHRDAALHSSRAGITLNRFVTDALQEKLERAAQ
jgi:predicted HicB family RNase H-like nuclease